MVGRASSHRGSLNMNVLDTVGLISSSFGLWMGVNGGENSALVDADGFKYINLQFKDDVLVGAQSLGHTQHIGVLRGLIQTGASLGEWKDKLMDDPMLVMKPTSPVHKTRRKPDKWSQRSSMKIKPKLFVSLAICPLVQRAMKQISR